jgi:outer membrane lipoprotein-sorting protein
MKFNFAFLVLVVLIAACTQESTESAPQASEPETVEKTADEAPAQYDATVAQLRDKGMGEDSFHYTFVRRERDEFGNFIMTDDYEVYILGDKTRKKYLEPQRLNNDVFYTDVYMDDKTAVVVCMKTGGTCSSLYKKAYHAGYEKEELTFTIRDVLDDLPTEATTAGSSVIDNRKTTIIAYTQSGNQYKIYVDDFSGLPLKQEVRIEENGKSVLVEESRFSLRDEITSEDVTLPSDWELQS